MTRRTNRLGTTLDALESRSLMAANVTASLSGQGVLTIQGTGRADQIVVREADGAIQIDDVAIRFRGQRYDAVEAGGVRKVVVNGKGGDDVIYLDLGVPSKVNAGGGNDWVYGGSDSDTVNGGAGGDLVYGNGGTDVLNGQAGNDFLDDGSRSQNEPVFGGGGADWNADLIAVEGTGFDDVHQRGSPSCSFLSSLSGLAYRGFDFTDWIEYRGMNENGMPEYAVAFWTGGGWHWQTVEFAGGLTELDTAPAAEGESWAVLMNRAWMAYHGEDGACFPHEAIFALIGQSPDYGYYVNTMMGNGELNAIVQTLQNEGLVIAGTGTPDFLTSDAIVNNHAYTVVDVVEEEGTIFIVMRNPWGVDGAAACGNPNDGIVWVTWEDFQQSMTYLAVIG